ncbi:MAG: ecotin family protein [Bacteroidia bacterium]|nr:ecotin family protein [Bacteroidia bacterium]
MKIRLFLLLSITLLLSCGSKKNALPPDTTYTQDEQAMLYEYPKLNGFNAQVIKVDPREDENLLKVQVVPGKQMEVDCNRHGLQGKYERKMLPNGETYFVFLSKGEVFSTRMGCPDNSKRIAFVPGPTIFIAYNSARPFVVYTPNGIGLKYRIWEADKNMFDVSDKIDDAVKNDATQALKDFPESLPGYDRYVLLLTPLSEKQMTTDELKVEIIPGKTEKVDCNQHTLNGNIKTEIVKGFGYQYLIFDSDSKYSSTRMGCPDDAAEKFIYGQTQTISYNSNMPTVIFVPKGFQVKYRVWKSPVIAL